MSDKNFDPGMKDTCELKEAWADGKKLYYVEDIPGLLEQISSLNKQLAKANERVKELEEETEGFKLRISKQKEIIGRYAKEAVEIAKAQEQFAIEQKIECMDDLKGSCNIYKAFPTSKNIARECVTVEEIDAYHWKLKEQLRKGGES